MNAISVAERSSAWRPRTIDLGDVPGYPFLRTAWRTTRHALDRRYQADLGGHRARDTS